MVDGVDGFNGLDNTYPRYKCIRHDGDQPRHELHFTAHGGQARDDVSNVWYAGFLPLGQATCTRAQTRPVGG